eukprot:TRINITY_DN8460_c0_g1_i14.p1 TRINITY_DN8460_c0_g1~~TRINITY_DN8460_c0_g1_i14.p1  ORF type:complete len:263 (-),score=23.63 TRINITY_DN8460_c0_g1_i14:445-1233(-)
MNLENLYKQLPIITRCYTTLAVATTFACTLEIVTPLQLYFNSRLIFQKYELWRLFTNFLFFGNLGIDFFFHMFFLVRYSKALEEGSFRGKSADFLWMLMFGSFIMLAIAPFVNVQFLGMSLTFMMVYVWGRRHQYVQLSFLGIFNFTAPYLPWVLLAFSLVLGGSVMSDLVGLVAGHIYYFLEDVYPRMSGRRLLQTPQIVKALFPRDDPIHSVDDNINVAQWQPQQQQPRDNFGVGVGDQNNNNNNNVDNNNNPRQQAHED